MIKNSLLFKLLILIQSVFFFTAPVVCAGQQKPLELWVHPYLPAAELVKRFNPLAEYLGKQAQREIEVRVSKSYKDHIQRAGEERVDLAYLGPAAFVKVLHVYGPKRLLARLEVRGSPVFYGMIVTRQDSPVKSLLDLKGRSFAFGDPNSTMSYIVPRFLLNKAGVELTDFENHVFLGSHHNVALGVIGKYYDAGGVKEEVYYQYKDRGLVMLAQSPPISEHLFIASGKISDQMVEKFTQSMLQLDNKTILTSIKKSVTGMVPATMKDYDSLKTILETVGVLEVE